DETAVRRLEEPGGEQHEARRAGVGLSGEQDAWLLAASNRVRAGRHELAEKRVQPRGRYPCGPTLERGVQRANQAIDMPAGPGRHVHPRRPGHPDELAIDLALEHLAALVVEQVPLVVRQYESPAGLLDHRDDAQVLFGQWLAGIDQDDGDLAAFQRRGRTQGGEVLRS